MKTDNDFGFSIVNEAELRKYEEELKKELSSTKSEINIKLEAFRSMIMPLLENLKKDSDKHYIYWPNRVDKINEFIKKIDSFVKDSSK